MKPQVRKYKLQIKNFFHLLEIAKRTKEDELILVVLDELLTLHERILLDEESPAVKESINQIRIERDTFAKTVAK
jgi:hypothetical protein